MVSPSGELVAPVSVLCHIAQQVPHLHVELAVCLRLHLGRSLVQVLLSTHQH